MPSSPLLNVWVKNVYNLFIVSKNEWNSSELVSTSPTPQAMKTMGVWDNPQVLPSIIHLYFPTISTLKNTIFHLLTSQLYPVSTTPIINPKKEKEER
jgi:hypothetical protein